VRFALLLAALTVAAPAFADDDALSGSTCETTVDCGSLRCVDGVCRDPLGPAPRRMTVGDDVMFGSGKGYGAEVAAIDIGATLVEPLLMLATQASRDEQQTIFGVACFLPVSLAGSATHWAHGRVVPGIISFFAWASHAGTTFVVAGLFGLTLGHGFNFDLGAAWAAGLVFGGLGAAALTALDVWMARKVTPRAPTLAHIVPSFAPTRGGAMAGVAGTF
jgi:hypothetical protein